MRIALLSGADKNAGDFLIVNRAKLLIEHFYPGCEIVEFKRNKSLAPVIDQANTCDAVVFAGGPGYLPNMYPEKFPLVSNLAEIRPPMFALGMGSWAPTPNVGSIAFTKKSRVLLERLEADGFGLGCRDRLSETLLKASGFESACFTGCPAWYDLERVGEDSLIVKPSRGGVRSIAVSDPATSRYLLGARNLVERLRMEFPKARVRLVFHRGWEEDEFTSLALAKRQQALVAWAREADVECVDISYGSEGFSVYDECDLHVGYRVHAHLYCTSRRVPTFLIEEDGRGWGANDALGRTHISISRPLFVLRAAGKALEKTGCGFCLPNRSLADTAKKMAAHVVAEVNGGYPECDRACRITRASFALMRKHLEGLGRVCEGKGR